MREETEFDSRSEGWRLGASGMLVDPITPGFKTIGSTLFGYRP